MTDTDRLLGFAYLDTTASGCWLWAGARWGNGYGLFTLSGRKILAHRAAYLLLVGTIPREDGSYHGCCVLHRCDERLCVRPDHLFLGSHIDNMADRDRKGRRTPPRGEANGAHKLTETQVRQIRMSTDPARTAAKRLGVSPATIYDIRNGKKWTHLADGHEEA